MSKKYDNKNVRRRPKRFVGACNNCGANGHKMKDCWALESNANSRPKWHKNKIKSVETSAVGMDGPPEIVLTSV